MPWSNLSYYTGRICGSWCPGWSGPLGPSTTGWNVRLQGHSRGNKPMRGSSPHPWRRICRSWGCRWLRPTSLTIIKPFTNILRTVQYWSYVWWWSGTCGYGYQSDGGNRKALTGREHRRRRWRQILREQRHKIQVMLGKRTRMMNKWEGNINT